MTNQFLEDQLIKNATILTAMVNTNVTALTKLATKKKIATTVVVKPAIAIEPNIPNSSLLVL